MIIAQRELKYTSENGEAVPVPMCVFSPTSNDQDWGCRYTIAWPNGVEDRTVYGLDQMQALILALQCIGASLYFSDYHKTGRLYHEAPGSGYGFPVPKNARDLLVGDDKTFDG